MNEDNTRRKCDLHVLSCNSSLFKRSVINMGIWFKIMPTESVENFREFEQRLKVFFAG
jgi:hypothetical protein